MSGDALVAGALGVATAAVWTTASAVGDLAQDIVAVGGAVGVVVAGGTWLWRKLLRPAAKAFQRVHESVEALEELGGFMEEQRGGVRDARDAAAAAAAKAEALTDRIDLLERHVGVFAAEDAARVRQAMALGELPDRRRSA